MRPVHLAHAAVGHETGWIGVWSSSYALTTLSHTRISLCRRDVRQRPGGGWPASANDRVVDAHSRDEHREGAREARERYLRRWWGLGYVTGALWWARVLGIGSGTALTASWGDEQATISAVAMAKH